MSAPDLYELCTLEDRSVLHEPALEVDDWTDQLDALARRLRYLCGAAENAIGLAAPQVGQPWAMCALKLMGFGSFVLVNPKVTDSSGMLVPGEEGCFSIPDQLVRVHRYSTVVVEFQEPKHGLPEKRLELEGLPARAAQHEIDHLNGLLTIDRHLQQQELGKPVRP